MAHSIPIVCLLRALCQYAIAGAAAIGGLVKGSKGAKYAAKVGVGVSIFTGGNKINIPADTLVETQFRAPFTAD